MTDFFQNVKNKLQALLKKSDVKDSTEEDNEVVCCGGSVHIAYRGISDDRMYMAYDRKWTDLRFFRQNGIRVFCAKCRHRLH
jgi:hypothetical protein